MSSPTFHLIQSLSASAVLYPIIGENVIPFGLAVIFIDIDHGIEYVADTNNFNPRGLLVYHEIITKNLDKNYLGLNVFHTFECYLLMLILAHWFPVYYYILLGFLFHHLADQIGLVKMGKPFVRAFSILEYAIRKKRHEISLKKILSQGTANIEGVPDINKWFVKWGINCSQNR